MIDEETEVKKIIDEFSELFEKQVVQNFQPKPGEDDLPYTIEIAERLLTTVHNLIIHSLSRLEDLKNEKAR